MGQKKRDDDTQVIPIRMEKAMADKIRKLAEAQDRSFADQARRLLKKGLGEVKD